ncbi:2-C-methyl-D-erythritol 4-phosphate cytidylyltransferase [Undibacterium sp. SXout7W]|uniref:2-C-methyl-D-erythritol 4-phosphate cytidylyltransferase n=1 Tax=Undibacterium sp. SXout7W TaxID=3413049 RepID=UPI003BF0E53D
MQTISTQQTQQTPQTSPTQQMQDDVQYVALIPAAGVGARMGSQVPKQYMTIGDKSILQHTIAAFLAFPLIRHVYVVVSEDDPYIEAQLESVQKNVQTKSPSMPFAPGERLRVLRCGGASRRDTVRNGLAAIATELGVNDWVLVHDAARPGIHSGLLQRLIDQVGAHAVGGLLALPVVDTMKRVVNGTVQTISREGMWLAQTPQMFRYRLLCEALDAIEEVTDESSAIEAAGYVPLLIEGHACNLKITLPADILTAQAYLTGAIACSELPSINH